MKLRLLKRQTKSDKAADSSSQSTDKTKTSAASATSAATPVTDEKAFRARRDTVIRAMALLIIASLALVFLGVFMVFSATAPSSISAHWADPEIQPFRFAIRQAIFALVGLGGGVVLAFMKYQWFRTLAWPIILLGWTLQGLVLVTGGEGVAGNNNWLVIGPLQMQPSEFLKLATVIWLAMMLARLSLEEIQSYRTLAIPAIGFVISIGLVVLGGDVGTGLIYILIGGGMFWLSGMKLKQLIPAAVAVVLLATVLVVSQPTRLTRVGDYFSNLFILPDTIMPTQSEYAMFAFGSGGITGVGIGGGKEKWRDLAEAHTDFIFAVIGEELGLIGVVTVIVLFLAIGWSLVTIAMNHPDRFGQLIAVGAALWLAGQAFANMWVVVGLLPVFGVPLPFVSMGGSSMMATLFMVGVVLSCGFGVPGVREAFRVRGSLARGARALVRRNS
ncbi:MAG: FtsW/RodA/SpoVE family cell cycle protein [Arcanobacterium sp.]